MHRLQSASGKSACFAIRSLKKFRGRLGVKERSCRSSPRRLGAANLSAYSIILDSGMEFWYGWSMTKHKDIGLELNQAMTALPIFMESYNQTLPMGFPRASLEALKEFQEAHPTLFKDSKEWSIDKHRKRLMDWLASYRVRS